MRNKEGHLKIKCYQINYLIKGDSLLYSVLLNVTSTLYNNNSKLFIITCS